MKKIIILGLLASLALAKTQSDVALTLGYNKFDDPEYLYPHRNYYGVRVGVYQDDSMGLQLGYEQTNSANCIGLKLKRYYANALLMTTLNNGLIPYGVGTLGYETSSADGVYRPSQAFVGIGAGVKYDMGRDFNIFLETRALKSVETEDVTYATTLGLGYVFDTSAAIAPVQQKEIVTTLPKKKQVVRREPSVMSSRNSMQREKNVYIDVAKKPIMIVVPKMHKIPLQSGYYVQVEALTTSSPKPMLRKLRAHGISNVHIKKMYKKGTSYSFVVVGPYPTRVTASRTLKKLKAISAGAFIKKF